MNEKIGRCHDCTAPQTEVNMLSRHILELQKDKGELIDKVRDLEEKLANADYQLEGRDNEIAELEAQIEKMKCCQNCLHLCGLCELGINGCYVCSKWEVRG